jgi:hypothetical protein
MQNVIGLTSSKAVFAATAASGNPASGYLISKQKSGGLPLGRDGKAKG